MIAGIGQDMVNPARHDGLGDALGKGVTRPEHGLHAFQEGDAPIVDDDDAPNEVRTSLAPRRQQWERHGAHAQRIPGERGLSTSLPS